MSDETTTNEAIASKPASSNSVVNTLEEILEIAKTGAQVAQTVPNGEVSAAAAIASALLQIAQKAVAAYEAQTGQPIDLSLLHTIDPVA